MINKIKKYSKQDPKKILEFINDRTENKPCPVCQIGETQLLLDDENNSSLAVQTTKIQTISTDGEINNYTGSCYVLACNHCGFQYSMNANFIISEMSKKEG
jgi:hypothetical protein